MSVPFSSRWVAKLCRNVWTVTRLLSPTPRRPAGGVQRYRMHRVLGIAAGEQPIGRTCQAPICSQDAEQLRRQHDIAILAPLTLFNTDHHAAAVDVLHLEADNLRGTQAGGIGSGQRRTRLQAGYRFQKAYDFIRTKHDRQLTRFPRVRNPLGQIGLAERDPI